MRSLHGVLCSTRARRGCARGSVRLALRILGTGARSCSPSSASACRIPYAVRTASRPLSPWRLCSLSARRRRVWIVAVVVAVLAASPPCFVPVAATVVAIVLLAPSTRRFGCAGCVKRMARSHRGGGGGGSVPRDVQRRFRFPRVDRPDAVGCMARPVPEVLAPQRIVVEPHLWKCPRGGGGGGSLFVRPSVRPLFRSPDRLSVPAPITRCECGKKKRENTRPQKSVDAVAARGVWVVFAHTPARAEQAAAGTPPSPSLSLTPTRAHAHKRTRRWPALQRTPSDTGAKHARCPSLLAVAGAASTKQRADRI